MERQPIQPLELFHETHEFSLALFQDRYHFFGLLLQDRVIKVLSGRHISVVFLQGRSAGAHVFF